MRAMYRPKTLDELLEDAGKAAAARRQDYLETLRRVEANHLRSFQMLSWHRLDPRGKPVYRVKAGSSPAS